MTSSVVSRSVYHGLAHWDFRKGLPKLVHLALIVALLPLQGVGSTLAAGWESKADVSVPPTLLTSRPTWSQQNPGYPAPKLTHAAANQTVRGDSQPTPPTSIAFIENVGQFDAHIAFQVQGQGGTILLTEDALWVSLWEPMTKTEQPVPQNPTSAAVAQLETKQPNNRNALNLRLTFKGSNPHPKIVGINPLATKVSYYLGNDENQWRENVPVWGGVRYEDLYPGWDLEMTMQNGESVWELVPNATMMDKQGHPLHSLTEIRLRLEGANSLTNDGHRVNVHTPYGQYRLPAVKLKNFQGVEPREKTVNGATLQPMSAQIEGDEIVLSLATNGIGNTPNTSANIDGHGVLARPATHVSPTPLSQVDPFNHPEDLLYATYFGSGLGGDSAFGMVLGQDSTGEIVYLTGQTNSPTLPGSTGTCFNCGGYDFFVTGLDIRTNQIIFTTYVGGSGYEGYWDADVTRDQAGNLYIASSTWSLNFPTTAGAFRSTMINSFYCQAYNQCNLEGVIFKVSNSGSLLYSTYFGGNSHDVLHSIVVDATGAIYVGGTMIPYWSPIAFPLLNPLDSTVSGDEGFLSKLTPAGNAYNFAFSTLLGGSGVDDVNDIALSPLDGSIYLVGETNSADFVTLNAYDASYNGGLDIFITRLNSAGTTILSSSYWGGSNSDGGFANHRTMGVTVDHAGAVYLRTATYSTDFPTTPNAYQPLFTPDPNVFIMDTLTKFSAGQLTPDYSTYIGSGIGSELYVDPYGAAYVIGTTPYITWTYPTTADAFDITPNGDFDMHIAKVNFDGTDLLYSTYVGGSALDGVAAITVDAQGYIYIAGATLSTDFPTTPNALQPTYQGSADSYLVVLNLAHYTVRDESTYTGSGTKAGGSDPRECPCNSTALATQGTGGDPINTRTGSFDYSIGDLSFPTAAGAIVFQRSYASHPDVLARYTTPLGYGWAHNQDTRLIFSDPGVVQFKGHTANLYRFMDNGNGIYTPYPGVLATLTRQADATFLLTPTTQTVYRFDANGILTQWSNANGNSFFYSYDVNGRLSRVEDDTHQRYLSFVYDLQGRLTTVADHTGRMVQYGYDTAGDLVSVTDVLGQVWTYTYDTAHRMTETHDPNGTRTMLNEYDTQGRVVRQFDAQNNLVVELTYLPNGNTLSTDAKGQTTLHDYNSYNTLGNETDALGGGTNKAYDRNFRLKQLTDAVGDTTRLTWSPDGANVTQVTDAEGHITRMTYDARNNLTSVTDSQGFVSTFGYSGTLLISQTNSLNETTLYTYTADGKLAAMSDVLGRVSEYGYDMFGQRVVMTDSQGNVSHFAYDALGRLVETTDTFGRVNRTEYDTAGRVVKSIRNYDALRPQNDQGEYNLVTEYAYDTVGNQVAMTDTVGRITRSEYDDNNRLIHSIDVAGNTTTNTYDAIGNLVVTIDALGNVTQYGYDALNRQVVVTDALGNTTHTDYNADGTMARTLDALGNATTYEYDSLKRNIATTDALGNVTRTFYDATGNVISTTDAAGNATYFEYDALNRVIRQTDALGGVTETFYDANGNRAQTVDANGHATTYFYDTLNRVISQTDALGNVTHFEYNALGNQVAVTDARGNTTRTEYDSLNRVVKMIDPLSGTTITRYNAVGNVASRTDANGNTTTYTYDILNRLVAQTDPLSGTVTFTYNAVGNRLTTTDANGNTTHYGYDALNRQVVMTDALGGVTTITYDAAGNRVATTDAKGHTTTWTYDALNRVISEQSAVNSVQTTAYNAVGNVVSTTDALGNVTTFTYDALNRQVAATDPLGHSTTSFFDAAGNRIASQDANGIVTHYEYDALNRLSAVIENYRPGFLSDAQTNVRTEYAYDANGNRVGIKNGRGQVTTFAYDALNRLTRETDSLGHATTYTYDAASRRQTMTDANGQTTTFVYDAVNRLTIIDYVSGTSDVNFTYDAGGRRQTMTDGTGTTTWIYDALNRPTSIVAPNTGAVQYGYDAVGNRAQLIYPDGKTVQYAYDAANRLSQVTDWNALVMQYAYDSANRLTTETRPNGVTTTYNYDKANRLTLLAHNAITQTLASYAYDYDAVGNRTRAIEKVLSPATSIPTVTQTATPTPSQTPLPSATPTLLPSSTPTAQPSATASATPKKTTPTPTNTPVPPTATATASPTPTTSQTPIATGTPAPTSTPSPTPAAGLALGNFVALGQEGIQLQPNSRIQSGSIGANAASVRPFLDPSTDSEVSLGQGAQAQDIYGDSVSLKQGAQARNVVYNELDNGGTITGTTHSPLALPLVSLPSVPTLIPGTQTIDVAQNGTATLTAGNYGKLTIRNSGVVTLTGGLYTFSEWDVRESVKVYFTAPTEIRIAGKLSTNAKTYIGPSPNATQLDARDIYILAVGQNGNNGSITASPNTVVIGSDNTLVANVYTPNGTLNIGAQTRATGAFLAKWVVIGQNAQLTLRSRWAASPTSQVHRPAHGLLALVRPAASPSNGQLRNVALLVTTTTTISYTYDALYRLTAADYSNNTFFHYTYDEMGNRLTQQTLSAITTYAYDSANRLIMVNGVAQTWDNNGNLLNDGVNIYTYDAANRLKTLAQGANTSTYTYNGQGDRVAQNVNSTLTRYTLDLNAGLTQVLDDGAYKYLYGNERIAQQTATTADYFLDDALGSVRQLADASGAVILAKSYEPFGSVMQSAGNGVSIYGYTAEQQDGGLVYLRARYYASSQGRFTTADPWKGNAQRPMSYNKWAYVYNNAINFADPSGLCRPDDDACNRVKNRIQWTYRVNIESGIKSLEWANYFIQQVTMYPDESGCSPADLSGIALFWNTSELESVEDALHLMKTFLDSTSQGYGASLGNGRVSIRRVAINTNSDTAAQAFTVPTFMSILGLLIPTGANTYVELPSWVFEQSPQEKQVGSIIHELSHAVDYSSINVASALLGGEKMYSDRHAFSIDPRPYNSVGQRMGPCGPTGYACTNSGETFAESLTIYSLYWLERNALQMKDKDLARRVLQNYDDISGQGIQRDPTLWNDYGSRLQELNKIFFGLPDLNP